jgi:hypothetical protein
VERADKNAQHPEAEERLHDELDRVLGVRTEGGKLRANTQTAALMKQVKTPAYLAISERSMEFDGKGKCVSSC